ncbi:hypothetical protein MTP99_003802 [Tenebrio molitor]|nr:hypothetical protein MTP99_003802 [Tenebrio molitor]
MEPSKVSVNYRASCTNCCVVRCHNNYSNTDKSVKFYSFPSKPHELERRRQWIYAIKRSKSDDCREGWEPKPHSRICSQHFVGNEKSNHPHNPAFLPTIFPETTYFNLYRIRRRTNTCLPYNTTLEKRRITHFSFNYVKNMTCSYQSFTLFFGCC